MPFGAVSILPIFTPLIVYAISKIFFICSILFDFSVAKLR